MSKVAALFIDSENISADYLEFVFLKIQELNYKILIKKSYKDWSIASNWNVDIVNQYGLEAIQIFHKKGNKNAADLKIVADIVEIIYKKPCINAFILVSSDGDFRDIIMRLRAHNKEIIGFGNPNCSKGFRDLFSIFFPLSEKNSISQSVKEDKKAQLNKIFPIKEFSADSKQEKVVALILEYLEIYKAFCGEKSISISTLGAYLKKPYKAFGVKNWSKMLEQEKLKKYFKVTSDNERKYLSIK